MSCYRLKVLGNQYPVHIYVYAEKQGQATICITRPSWENAILFGYCKRKLFHVMQSINTHRNSDKLALRQLLLWKCGNYCRAWLCAATSWILAESRPVFEHAPRSEEDNSLFSMKVGPFGLKRRLGVKGILDLLQSIGVDTKGLSGLFGEVNIGLLHTTELTRHSPFSFDGALLVFSSRVLWSEVFLLAAGGSALLKQVPIVAPKERSLSFLSKKNATRGDWIVFTCRGWPDKSLSDLKSNAMHLDLRMRWQRPVALNQSENSETEGGRMFYNGIVVEPSNHIDLRVSTCVFKDQTDN